MFMVCTCVMPAFLMAASTEQLLTLMPIIQRQVDSPYLASALLTATFVTPGETAVEQPAKTNATKALATNKNLVITTPYMKNSAFKQDLKQISLKSIGAILAKKKKAKSRVFSSKIQIFCKFFEKLAKTI